MAHISCSIICDAQYEDKTSTKLYKKDFQKHCEPLLLMSDTVYLEIFDYALFYLHFRDQN